MKVRPGTQTIRLDGKEVEARPTTWVLLHKPRGYVTTRDDESGRRTVYDLLPSDLHHLFHVGRLDRDSSGVLLLTNDGETANRLLHPRYGTTKKYRVDVEGQPEWETMQKLLDGVPLEDGIANALEAELQGEIEPGIYRVLLTLEEGRNREVRRMMEAVGHPVHRLYRLAFGPISVGKLPPGKWRRLRRDEIQKLRGG